MHPSLDADTRLAALELAVSRLLLAEARRSPDPAGMLDATAGRLRQDAEMLPGEDGPDRLALAAALLQLVTLAKERLITEQYAPE